MKKWRIVGLASIALLIFAAAYILYPSIDDKVALTNSSGNENGILVNAQGSSGVLSDTGFTSTANTVKVGRLTAAAKRNEVIAFTDSRPVAIKSPVTWTTGPDTVNLPFADEIQLSITVWILKGPFAGQSQAAKNRCVDIAAMWKSERMGVAFADPDGCDVRDATSTANIGQFINFNCNKQMSLQQAIPPVPNRINIYVVDLVRLANGSTGNGNGTSCGTSDFVALGSNWNAGLAVHELGHNFSLIHIDDSVSEFDETNIMYSASDTRQYFSEGQIFRAHFTPPAVPPDPDQPGSALNSVYTGARAGQPTRDCAIDPSLCPKLEKRIWADGTKFPPN
jgi:hypothetical protein